MGIFGLTTFINCSSQYFENHHLKDTLIIIDGYALTNFLYNQYENQTSAFGGDYNIIAKIYIHFINLLLRCNVTPIFVFDGAYEQRKIETIMRRMRQRIQSYNNPVRSEECRMPYFASDILFDILNDMDIPHIHCDFEADSEIVALAKLLNCPIVSRDSDFYVNTVPYIPLDMITLDLKSTENFINCQIYKVEKLLNEFGGLKADYLPLVAALLGNDYIKPDTFSTLLKLNPGTFDCGLKLQRITDWLRNQENVDSAIDNMTNYFIDYNDYIKNQIQKVVKEYNSMNSKYLAFILQYKRMSKYQIGLNNYLKSNEKSILPHWLEHNYRRGKIKSEVMTIITLKKIIFSVQIEDYKQPPYYEVSFNILESIIGLLFEKNDSITGIGRKDGFNIGQYTIKPYKNNPYVPLTNLNKTDLEYRKNIILNLIGIRNFNGIPKEWELFILVLIYWSIHTNNDKTSNMHALIVSAMTFNIIKKIETDSQNKIFKDCNDKTKSTIEENISKVEKEDCIKAMAVLSKYFQVDQYNDINLYYKIIHPFAQFQSCVYFFMILNSLLDFPYNQCRIENFFNGSFLYILCVKMKNCDPELFISQKLFGENLETLNKVYKSITSYMYVLLSVSKKSATTVDARNSEKLSWRNKLL